MKIVIDAGHGGVQRGSIRGDSGAVGKYSYEKDNVLKVALRLKTLLEQAGHTVYMTRSTDVYLTLSERARAANRWKADYFISLHNNAASNRSASGFETFIFNGKVSANTVKFQQCIHKTVSNELKIKDRGMKRANFAVLRETSMPSVLIEYAFISNDDDEHVLINKIEQMAITTAQGVVNCLGGNPIPSNTVASTAKPKKPSEPPKKERNVDDMIFSSPSLKDETKLTLNSKTRREMLMAYINANGGNKIWQEKFDKKEMTNDDLMALIMKIVIDAEIAKVKANKDK